MPKTLISFLAAFLFLCAQLVAAATLQVGPQRALKTPSAAAALAKDGDTVEIDAGEYRGDVAVWRQNQLILRGVGGQVSLKAQGASAEGKAIWVIRGNKVTVEHIDFSGAQVSDGNGAGIRIEGTGLTLRHCGFFGNQDGVLSGANPESDILVEYSEFANNGGGDGQSHNIYIGAVRSFTLRYSYVHHAHVGHQVKTRAQTNYILYNRIMDEASGNASYTLDISNGGLAYVIGNLLQQGPQTENYTMVSYAAEGLRYPVNTLYLVNNTLVNDFPDGGYFVAAKPDKVTVKLINNLFVGKASLDVKGAEQTHNVWGSAKDLLAVRDYDYHLSADSKAINAGVDPGSAPGYALKPLEEYVHKANKMPRPQAGPLDAGAYEFVRSTR